MARAKRTVAEPVTVVEETVEPVEIVAAMENPPVRTLRVINNYVGSLTKEKFINEGVYQEDDPRLFGLGEYLVTTMKDAIWV